MLETLKFVQGAVASKGFAPELTHFCIKDGMVKGFNGALALASPIDLALDVTPKAIPFIKAILACKDTTTMTLTPTGRLSIKSGKFKAFVECIDDTYPDVQPEGEKIPITGDFMSALKKVAPFIAEDASKPWARGVLFNGQTITATNNIVVVQHWLTEPFPVKVNVPINAVKELIRIKDTLTHFSMSDRSITFYYSSGRWLRSNLIETAWPDIDRVLDKDSNQQAFPEGFFMAIEDIKHFAEETGRLILADGKICTTLVEGEGASVLLDNLPANKASFNTKHLASIEGVADTIDLSQYPAPCIFYGDNLRGAIIGMIL